MHLAPRRDALHESSRHSHGLHVGLAPRVGPSRNSTIALPRRPKSDDHTLAKTIGHQLTSNDMTGAFYVVRKEQCGGIELWGLIQTMGRMHLAPLRESLHESSRHIDMTCVSAQHPCGPFRNSTIALTRRPKSDEHTLAKTIGHQLTSNDKTTVATEKEQKTA